MSEVAKKHWNELEKQLRKWNFKEFDDLFSLSYSYQWSRPDESNEDLNYSINLNFDRVGKFFTVEMDNEHGHYSDTPLPKIICINDVIDIWKSLTGQTLSPYKY